MPAGRKATPRLYSVTYTIPPDLGTVAVHAFPIFLPGNTIIEGDLQVITTLASGTSAAEVSVGITGTTTNLLVATVITDLNTDILTGFTPLFIANPTRIVVEFTVEAITGGSFALNLQTYTFS